MKSTHKLYNGTIELSFDPGKHVYTVNSENLHKKGEKVESVTRVLKSIAKPALIAWSAKMASEYVERNLKPGIPLSQTEITNLCYDAKRAHRVKAEDSANLGTLAHEWFENYMSGKDPSTPMDRDLRNITEAFLRFVHKYDIHPMALEKKLYSLSLNVAGTCD